jgi:hypothetical protein
MEFHKFGDIFIVFDYKNSARHAFLTPAFMLALLQ